MPNIYSNLPLKTTANQNATILAFDTYYEKPLELDSNIFEAMKSFFTSRGFETSAAESVVVIIIKQAKKDGYNPLKILDTLKGLTNVEISALVSEIVNNNRLKTSFLGYGLAFEPNFEVARNIINSKIKRLPPTYTITKSRESVNEGQQITFLITTENVRDNTMFYWTLSGTGITSGDITGGQLSGTTVVSNSTASVTVTLALDSLTEGNEILVFELRKGFISSPVIASSNVTVNDIFPKYTITKSRESVNEGQQITFLIATENVRDNTMFYWTLSGTNITSGDIIGGQLSGTIVISNSAASVTVTLASDSLTEGNEILVFELRKESVSSPVVASSNVTVNDVSFATLADYMVIECTFDTGSDLDIRARLAVPSVASSNGKLHVGWRQADRIPNNNIESPNILRWGGDNVGIGRESAVFDINYFKTLYPSTNNIVIDCRARWYGRVGTTPVGLKITLYQGGTIEQDGYGFENPTATSSTVLDLTLKYVTEFTQSGESIGERIATVSYNLLTGVGSVNSADNTTYPHP